MPTLLIVSEVARRINVAPKRISDLFYARKLDDTRCPIVGGRRLIPEDYVAEIVAALAEQGLLPRPEPSDADARKE